MIKALLAWIFAWATLAGVAQSAYYQDAPGEILIVRERCVSGCEGANPKIKETYQQAAGVIAEGDRFSLVVVNHSNKPLYYAIVDMQPDTVLNIIAPISGHAPDEYRVRAHDTASLGADLTVSPPYGVDKLVIFWSETPIDLNRWVSDNTRGVRENISLLQELKWILQGLPSSAFAHCRFGFTDIVIIPKTSGAHAHQPAQHGWAAHTKRVIEDECGAAQKAPQKMFTEFPVVFLVQPYQSGATRGISTEHKVQTQAFVLKGTAAAQKGVKSVVVNGEAGTVTKHNDVQYYWEKEVRLKPGRNQFQVVVETSDGRRNCESVAVDYEPPANVANAPGANHLLLIGINEYVQWKKLQGARRDVDSIGSLLTTRFGFADSNVHKLTDAACTKEGIDSAFRSLISTLGPSDNLVVYFAGHGTLDKQVTEGYWIPVDARLQKPIDYVSNTEIKKYLEAMKARHVLVIADACFAGGFFKTNRGESFEQKMERVGSRWLLCSGREELVDDVMPGTSHSPFAFYLMKFLRAAPDAVTASQLFQDVKVAVAGNSKQTPIGGPVTNAGDEGGEFVFRKKKNK
ncbi:MAG: hypothetical protein EOO15_19770 [Chitinophagaceae bacterium]|nr:MAG: hypothetical protein EOO15_19770 [Chitinophagaceae bacterium]